MARFNFGKRSPEDEGVPPEPVEGETDIEPAVEFHESGSRVRRPLIFAVIGVLLIGGAYLANILFFSAPPPPPVPVRPAVPVPSAPSPAPTQPVKPTVPAAPPVVQSKPEVKAESKGEMKTTPPPLATPSKTAASEPSHPAKAAPPATKAPAPAPPAAKPAAKAATKVPTLQTKGFSVQVGAMAQEANAENLKRKLDAMGFQAVIRKTSGSANSHVVTVGEPAGKQEVEELSRRLNVDGFPSQLVAVDGKYVAKIGSFVNLDEAIDLARELQKKNYRPKITSKPASTVLFQVRHGHFDTRAAAAKRGEELKAKGFNAWVVTD